MKSVKTILVTLSLVSLAFVSDGFADPPGLKGKEQLKNPSRGSGMLIASTARSTRKAGTNGGENNRKTGAERQRERFEW